jgi:hypothetical protein
LKPNSKEHCGLYIIKDATDSQDFRVKMDIAIKTSYKEIFQIDWFEWESNLIQIGSGRGCPNFLKNDEIFDNEIKYISDNTLTLIIHVGASN